MAMFPHQSQEAQDASARVAEKAYNALGGNEKKALLDQAAKVIESLHREREAGLKDGTWPIMSDGSPLTINDDPVAHAKNALMHNGYIYQRALDDLTERRSDAPAAAVSVQAAVENSNPAITPDKVEALSAAISQMKDASGEPKFSPERAAQLSAGIAEYYNEYVQQHGNAASSRRAVGVVIDGALQTPEALGHLVGGQQRREIHAHSIIPDRPAGDTPGWLRPEVETTPVVHQPDQHTHSIIPDRPAGDAPGWLKPTSASPALKGAALLDSQIIEKHSVISERTQTKEIAIEVEGIAHKLGIDSSIVNNDGVLTKAEIQAVQEKTGATSQVNRAKDGSLDGIIGPDTLAHIKQALAAHNVSAQDVTGVSAPIVAAVAVKSGPSTRDMA
ncbi:MAG: hypothetical protein U1E36_03320 [Rickettsiales bacterium]